MINKNLHVIIDSGHGWETKGKESMFFYINKKALLKENNFNEAIANKLSLNLYNKKISKKFITNEWNDISLYERVRREKIEYNFAISNNLKPIFISVHADAFKVKNKATKGRFYYNSENGKLIAEHMTNVLNKYDYKLGLRKPLKANFYVLKNTSSPAILFEAGFMTSMHDLKYLLDDDFRNNCANLLAKGLETLNI